MAVQDPTTTVAEQVAEDYIDPTLLLLFAETEESQVSSAAAGLAPTTATFPQLAAPRPVESPAREPNEDPETRDVPHLENDVDEAMWGLLNWDQDGEETQKGDGKGVDMGC